MARVFAARPLQAPWRRQKTGCTELSDRISWHTRSPMTGMPVHDIVLIGVRRPGLSDAAGMPIVPMSSPEHAASIVIAIPK